MHRLLATALALSFTTGCVVYSDDHDHQDEPVVVETANYAPVIDYAEAGCYWDSYNGDFVWYFDSQVWDSEDWVTGVYADVYDARGEWVDSFELYNETADPYIWFSDWLQYSTYLDCYYGGYVVDFVAYDAYEHAEIITVYPYTY
jgi:hypothetical protein